MPESWLEFFQDPERRRTFFFLLQPGLVVALIGYFVFTRKSESSFRIREAELRKGTGARRDPALDQLAQAKRKPKAAPLLLEGIQTDGPAHEILGVARSASAEEIQKAYRERMKRYHPDIVGRPGSREWHDAQKIAEALNRAKAEMLDSLKNG